MRPTLPRVFPSLTPIAVLIAAAGLVGCDQLSALAPGRVDIAPPVVDDSHLPPAVVELPAVPPLELLDTPPTLPDGSWAVAGLLLNRDELRGQSLTVTAVLESIYRCEGAAEGIEGEAAELAVPREEDTPAVQRRAGCLLPHFQIVDSLRSPYMMLVAGYDEAFYEPQLRPGTRYRIEGRYVQQTRGFTSTEYGLIVATRIEGEGIVHPPPAEPDAPAAPR